ncbi:MAG: Gfo/Idh/MocA family oxidoreductase [Caldilineaceae bacterium]|nr:Gfo/Idh/MocA family oxidoreductase [Caldilineaceae bacterium]
MSKTYRVGIIGFAHMHINSLAAQFAEHPQVALVAGADTEPARPELRDGAYTRRWNIRHAQEKLGLPKMVESYQTLLEEEQLDIVICCAENAKHAEVVEACAAAGVHVIVEKPMASSLAHGLRMARAARAANTKLVVNWPLTWSPAARKAKALLDEGVIGRVLEVKWRGGHLGPLGYGVSHPGIKEGAGPMSGVERGATWWHQQATGGGAMLDYCCYGSMVARWYIGEQALAAVGMRANLNSQWGDAEDNAAMIVRFPSAMALFEASWTTHDHGVSPGPIVYGTEGTMVVERPKGGAEQVRVVKAGGESSTHAADPLTDEPQNVAQAMIDHLDNGTPLHRTLDLDFNLEAMAILDAGVRAAESGQLAMVENATWRIGGY